MATNIKVNSILTNKSDNFLLVIAFLLGFSSPISIVLTNITLIFVLISLITCRDFSQLSKIITHPLFYLATIIFILFASSLLYRDNPYGPILVRKYRKLLYVLPIALFFLQDKRLALMSFKGFIVANAVVLILSSLAWLDWFPVFDILPDNPTVFNLHITQNFFMAISCVVWLQQACYHHRRVRWVYSMLFVLGVCNVLFMVQGRIGYLTLAVGLGVWLWMVLKNKQRLFVVIIAMSLVVLVGVIPNDAKDRIQLGINEINQCINSSAEQKKATCDTSMGLRTQFFFYSIDIIKKNKIFGVGAGGFSYESEGSGTFHNPHNEYLAQMVNAGIISLIVFLTWNIVAYQAALGLVDPAKHLMLSVITAYAIGNLFNSFILDAIEGQVFIFIMAYLLTSTIKRTDSLMPKQS